MDSLMVYLNCWVRWIVWCYNCHKNKKFVFQFIYFFFRRAIFIYQITWLINFSSFSFSFSYFIILVLFFATTHLCAWFFLCECISLFPFVVIPLYMGLVWANITICRAWRRTSGSPLWSWAEVWRSLWLLPWWV